MSCIRNVVPRTSETIASARRIADSMFPGANGVANATPAQYTQVDRDGKPLATLPPVWKGKDPDPAFPRDLANKPFRIDAQPINLPLSTATRDLIHEFYRNQEQINGGRNDRFVAASDAGALTMGYYDGSKLPMWKWAQEYTLADNFFMNHSPSSVPYRWSR